LRISGRFSGPSRQDFVNSAAVRDKTLIERAAERFGSQCVVVAVDARRRKTFGL
jgi:imidazole glycerol phosphate synthase subunit HisF